MLLEADKINLGTGPGVDMLLGQNTQNIEWLKYVHV